MSKKIICHKIPELLRQMPVHARLAGKVPKLTCRMIEGWQCQFRCAQVAHASQIILLAWVTIDLWIFVTHDPWSCTANFDGWWEEYKCYRSILSVVFKPEDFAKNGFYSLNLLVCKMVRKQKKATIFTFHTIFFLGVQWWLGDCG